MELCGRIFKKMPPTPFCTHPAPKSLYKGEPLLSPSEPILRAIIENMISPDQYTNFGPSPKKTLSKTKEYDAAIAIIACKEWEGESLSLFLLVCSRWTTVTTGLLLQPLRQGLYWRPPIQTNAYQCIPICINMLLLLYNQLYIWLRIFPHAGHNTLWIRGREVIS